MASYGGDPAFATSASGPATLTVVPEPSTVTLTSSLNPSTVGSQVTFTATASAPGIGIPLSGTFTFSDGSTQLGQPVQSANGSATYSTNALALGTHPIIVIYSGNSSVLGRGTPLLNQTVNAYSGDFTLNVSPGAANLYTGESAQFTITATPQSGFNLPLAVSCPGLPVTVTCSFAPASLASGQTQTMLVLQTAAPVPVASASRIQGGAAMLAAFFGLLYIPRRFRRARWISLVLLAIVATCSSCSNPQPLTGGTLAGTYQIVVTAQTSGAGPQLSRSTTISLTVKSLF
jgi:hypothetical protein